MAFASGYTMAGAFTNDILNWIYVALAAAWSVVLIAGIVFLVIFRDLPFLRIRNIPLAVSAVATLHVYWCLCMIAYKLQGYFPCATEYWIMSIYLPLGIALFHACNTQLLHIAGLQRNYTAAKDLETVRKVKKHHKKGWHQYLPSIQTQNSVKRTMAVVAYGLLVQLFCAMLIFLLSRKFHPGFGFTSLHASETTNQKDEFCAKLETKYHIDPSWPDPCGRAKKFECRRGWEWAPSIVWQFLWSWAYAPYLLWKLRGIRDVHGWRKQTVCCCIAGLPATPMWLAALYIPQMYKVNKYFAPPLWFAPSIFLIEASLIFVPAWQVLKNQKLQRETLNIIAEWEEKIKGSSNESDSTNTGARLIHKTTTASTTSSRRGEMYTMTALDSALRTNPQPLLLFAALKDFSGENISFLSHVSEWRRKWSPASPRQGYFRRVSVHNVNNRDLQRQQFKTAIEIYASFVSLKYSEFPINLSSGHLKELEAVFEGPASTMHGDHVDDSDAATPFNKYWSISEVGDLESSPSKECMSMTSTVASYNSTDDIISQNCKKHSNIVPAYKMNVVVDKLPENITVPPQFDPHIFDHAEESIKYMVLTNTWPKFVNAGYANSIKEKTGWTVALREKMLC